MSSNFQKTTSNFFVTFLIGLIVVSFMFTGYESMKGSPGAIAKVGSHPITGREYQMEYNRQINFYKNAIFGGKDLSSEDIERFGIKSTALKNLVQSKLVLIFADQSGLVASPKEVKETIKKFDFFLTNGQFDINKYKLLLRNNGLSPKDFEEDITSQVTSENAEVLFSQFPISDGYINDVGRFKAMRYNAYVAEIKEANLLGKVPVSKTERSEYLKNEANSARTESLFNERKASLDVPEKLKASHILIRSMGGADELKEAKKKIDEIAKKVNTKNFKRLANQYSEDPSNKDQSGKKKGGFLGIFGRGRMVPEFEKVAFTLRPGSISEPVKTNFGYHLIYVEKKIPAKMAKFEDFREEIATELIRQSKTSELEALMKKVVAEVSEAIKQGQMKKLDSLQKQYGFALDKEVEFNRFEGSLGQIQISSPETKKVFAGLKDKESNFYQFDLAAKKQVIAIQKSYNKDLPQFDAKKEKNSLQMVLSNRLKTNVLKKIGDDTPVKQFAEI